MYLMNTRPDICFAVNTLSQFLIDSRHVHLIAKNNILRYVKGTFDYGLKYEANQKINLEGYVDSDWAGSSIDRKSTLGCCFSLGSNMISWISRNHSSMALSTTQAEYIAVCSASCEVVWLWNLFSEFDLKL